MFKQKRNKKIIIFMACFYVAVAILAAAFLNIKGSVFEMRSKFTSSLEGNTKSELQKTIVKGSVASENRPEPVEAEPEEPQTMVMDEDTSITVQPGVLVEEPAEPEPEKHYYEFTAINAHTILHMREEPDIKSKSIYKLKPGTKGYVLEVGDDWSYVTAEEHAGYCSNEYLNMREIPEEEYPEELR